MAAGEQYLRLAVSFVLVAALSRLLTPAEVGVAIVGSGVMTLLLALREFATSDFLIQRPRIEPDDVRTTFTISMLTTGAIALAVWVSAPGLAAWYGEPVLAPFLRILAVAGLVETISGPIGGLLRRDLSFGTIAAIAAAGALTNAGVTIGLATAGFGPVSVAWGAIAASCVVTMASFAARPYWWCLKPSLAAWRAAFAFGGYNGATTLLNRAYETLPQLVLGRFLSPAAVGLYNRAIVMSGIPDKVVLTSVFAVAFPALAAASRAGRDLKLAYLRALALITVLYWPAQALLALLAYPAVMLLLGPQWTEVAPLLRVIALAALAWFPVILTAPMLLALGANRERFAAELLGRGVAAAALCGAAYYGVMAMALSQLALLPFQMAVAMWFVRRHVGFGWREVAAAIAPSAVVTACSLAGPLGVVAAAGFSLDLPVGIGILAAFTAIPGWFVGVLLVRHCVLDELARVTGAVRSRLPRSRDRAPPPVPL